MVHDDHAVLRQPDVELQSVRAERQAVVERRNVFSGRRAAPPRCA